MEENWKIINLLLSLHFEDSQASQHLGPIPCEPSPLNSKILQLKIQNPFNDLITSLLEKCHNYTSFYTIGEIQFFFEDTSCTIISEEEHFLKSILKGLHG